MKLTPIVDDGFNEDTAPSTPYVARRCRATGWALRVLRSFVLWFRTKLRALTAG